MIISMGRVDKHMEMVHISRVHSGRVRSYREHTTMRMIMRYKNDII